jgi:hypothetical protein
MPMDTNLLYGEMAGSWLVHLAIPAAVAVLFSYLPSMSTKTRGYILLGGTVLLSFLVQAGLLTSLQAAACKGVKDYGSIFTGAAIAAVITAVLAAIPIFFEPMRLAVSQIFIRHMPELTEGAARLDAVASEAANVYTDGVISAEGQNQQEAGALLNQRGGALTSEQYAEQERRELTIGTAYWTAFAGAYGIGVGSLVAAKCPAVSTPPRPMAGA